MSLISGAVVFFLIWWVSLFAVLPFGHEREQDGKPVKANMKKKVLWTTIIAVVIWGIVFAVIQSDLISFREMALTMTEEDRLR